MIQLLNLDIQGIIIEIIDFADKNSKNSAKPYKLWEITILERSKYSIKIYFRASYIYFNSLLINANVGDVIQYKNAKVGYYGGKKCLYAYSFDSMMIMYLNPLTK